MGDVDDEMREKYPQILLTGATGYVGNRLLARFERAGRKVRCLARSPAAVRSRSPELTEVVRGDVLNLESLKAAASEVKTAYYLVHLMGAGADFESQDRQAARNFAEAARQQPSEPLTNIADTLPHSSFATRTPRYSSE